MKEQTTEDIIREFEFEVGKVNALLKNPTISEKSLVAISMSMRLLIFFSFEISSKLDKLIKVMENKK